MTVEGNVLGLCSCLHAPGLQGWRGGGRAPSSGLAALGEGRWMIRVCCMQAMLRRADTTMRWITVWIHTWYCKGLLAVLPFGVVSHWWRDTGLDSVIMGPFQLGMIDESVSASIPSCDPGLEGEAHTKAHTRACGQPQSPRRGCCWSTAFPSFEAVEQIEFRGSVLLPAAATEIPNAPYASFLQSSGFFFMSLCHSIICL